MPIIVDWYVDLHTFVNHSMVLGWIPIYNVHKNIYKNWLTFSGVEKGITKNDNSQT